MVRIRFEIFLDSRLFIAINVHQQSIDINHVSILKMLIHIKLIDRKYTIPNLTTCININENIDKQYDNKDRISGDIICPLLSYNNDMSIPRKQRAVSHSFKWKTQPRGSTETTIHVLCDIKK